MGKCALGTALVSGAFSGDGVIRNRSMSNLSTSRTSCSHHRTSNRGRAALKDAGRPSINEKSTSQKMIHAIPWELHLLYIAIWSQHNTPVNRVLSVPTSIDHRRSSFNRKICIALGVVVLHLSAIYPNINIILVVWLLSDRQRRGTTCSCLSRCRSDSEHARAIFQRILKPQGSTSEFMGTHRRLIETKASNIPGGSVVSSFSSRRL